MGAVEKVFDNFEILCSGYADLPEAREARDSMYGYLDAHGIDMVDAGHHISTVVSEYEKQGFLYGFRYAAALLLDGGGVAV